MGGYGSGRWHNHTKKRVVEDCLSISITDLCHDGILKQTVGRWVWRGRGSSIGFAVNAQGGNPSLRLQYTHFGAPIDETIRMVMTRPNWGGVRWFFLCPLSVNGQPCRRRVGKLYLPPGGNLFGCRHCYDLSYRTRQEYDKRVAFYRKHPESIKAELAKAKLTGEVLSPHQILLLTKAIDGGVNWQNPTKTNN